MVSRRRCARGPGGRVELAQDSSSQPRASPRPRAAGWRGSRRRAARARRCGHSGGARPGEHDAQLDLVPDREVGELRPQLASRRAGRAAPPRPGRDGPGRAPTPRGRARRWDTCPGRAAPPARAPARRGRRPPPSPRARAPGARAASGTGRGRRERSPRRGEPRPGGGPRRRRPRRPTGRPCRRAGRTSPGSGSPRPPAHWRRRRRRPCVRARRVRAPPACMRASAVISGEAALAAVAA